MRFICFGVIVNLYKHTQNYTHRVFFLLKEHHLIQQLVIKNLLDKHYTIQELAKIIGIEVTTIYSLQKGKFKLKQQTLDKLIHLFYQLNN